MKMKRERTRQPQAVWQHRKVTSEVEFVERIDHVGGQLVTFCSVSFVPFGSRQTSGQQL